MIFNKIDTLIKNNKVEEALMLLESYVSKLPEIFQTTFSVQYSSYTKYKWDSFIDVNDSKDLNRLKKRLLDFCRSIDTYEETGEIPTILKETDPKLQIDNSKNFNTGTITTIGNVNIGDNSK